MTNSITVNIENKEVTTNGETCNFIEAGLISNDTDSQPLDRQEIQEVLQEKGYKEIIFSDEKEAWDDFKLACKNGMLRVCKNTNQSFIVSQDGNKFWYVGDERWDDWKDAESEGVEYGEMEIPSENDESTVTYYCAQQKNSDVLCPVGENENYDGFMLMNITGGLVIVKK